MGQVKTVSIQFNGQRKPQEYVVYPASYSPKEAGKPERFFFQSDNACGCVDDTGLCFYQPKSNRLYMIGQLGTVKLGLIPELVQAIKDAQPKSGDTIGNGVVIIA